MLELGGNPAVLSYRQRRIPAGEKSQRHAEQFLTLPAGEYLRCSPQAAESLAWGAGAETTFRLLIVHGRSETAPGSDGSREMLREEQR